MNRFNCLPNDAMIGEFSSFVISPCRNDRSQAQVVNAHCETEIVNCAAHEAEFWTIYGYWREDNIECMAVHDAFTEIEIVRIAAQINAETGKGFQYFDEQYGTHPRKPAVDFCTIAEWLTDEIHHEIPMIEEEDGRVDDFDNHDLAAMREAFVEYSNYSGLKTARDPYQQAPDFERQSLVHELEAAFLKLRPDLTPLPLDQFLKTHRKELTGEEYFAGTGILTVMEKTT